MRILICALLLATLSNPASALTAPSQADGGVTIRPNVSTGAVLDPGDRIKFQYQSARDGAVILLDIDTQGYVSLLTDEPLAVRARETGRLPNDGSELIAEGEPGVDFIFALAVSDPGVIDSAAFASLRSESRRITGDPFVAANIIAAELIRDISQHTVFMGYTYFYVSERVDYPCYLCGECDGYATSSDCIGYQIAQNFDLGVSLSYPLARGYDMIDVEVADHRPGDVTTDDVPMPGNDDVVVNFYPYGSEVHYADPVALNMWYDWGWYDPFYWSYPYCYPYSGFSVGIGWGWGWWGWNWGWGCGYPGYYCSGWYSPGWGCGGGYYPGYPSYKPVEKYKSAYKSNSTSPTLAQNRTYAMKRDGALRVASKNVRSTPKSVAYTPRSRSKTGFATPNHRVKTSISGTRSVTRGAWAQGRSGSSKGGTAYRGGNAYRPRGTASYRGGSSAAGRTLKGRPTYRSHNPGYSQQRNDSSTRMKSTQPHSSRGQTSWAPSSRGTPRSSGTSPRMGSYKGSRSSSAYRGGSSHGGSRSGGRGKGR